MLAKPNRHANTWHRASLESLQHCSEKYGRNISIITLFVCKTVSLAMNKTGRQVGKRPIKQLVSGHAVC